MIKLIIGVTLLILILITSYYILVEKEPFQNYQPSSIQDRECGEGSFRQSDYSNIHRFVDGSYRDAVNNIPDSCYGDFLKDPMEFYKKYKQNLNTGQTPIEFKQFHEKMLQKSLEPSDDSKHDTGNLIPKSTDKSHCALYTHDCNLAFENPDFYTDQDKYITSNLTQLSMCHADDDCKLEDTRLTICKNKCNQNVEVNQSCKINGCSSANLQSGEEIMSSFSLKDQYKCYERNETDCKSIPQCRYVEGEYSYCTSNCYNLNKDECENYEHCYKNNDRCYARGCYPNNQSSFPTNVTNPVSNLDLRNHYCMKKCNVDESPENKCSSFDTNRCSRESKCSVNEKFNVPKCVPNNVN